ncbi:MAG: Isoprenyl transferase [Acidobacteriota bacterium]|nr:Isoprenyl transferase [Acidobacteriota bacterium]
MSEPSLRVAPGSLEESLLRQIDRSRLPRHVAIIMDGNGRWAGKRFLPRIEGHRAGVQAVRETVESAARLGVEFLTLYAFSIENWKRPRHEVWTLMNLLKEFLRREIRTLVDNDIRLHILGRWRELDPSVVGTLEGALAKTAAGKRMVFNIALNYSGRCEIVDACRKLVRQSAAGEPVEFDEAAISAALETAGQPDPDLLIRTSGEMRVSNFLLWQIAYSEIFVTPTLWPDFRLQNLLEAIVAFQGRERRFGGIEAPVAAPGAQADPAGNTEAAAGEAAAEANHEASPAHNSRQS